MKKRLLLLATAIAVCTTIWVAPAPVRAQNAGPAISVNVTSPISGAFSVDVKNTTPTAGFSAYNVRLTYDPAKLAVVTAAYNPTSGPPISATDMTFTSVPSGNLSCPAPLVDNVAGSVSFGCVTAPPVMVFTAGTLVRFSFVTRPGPGGVVALHLTTQAELGLGGTLTFDPDGTPQANALTDANVTLLADADGDGLPDASDPCPSNADCDSDQVSDGSLAPVGSGLIAGPDNCPTVANGPAQAGIPGVGNQTNTDGGNSVLGLAGQDTLGDACDTDKDGDGYTGAQEAVVVPAKSDTNYCGSMRADVNTDHTVTIGDLGKVAQYFGQSIPPAGAAPERYNQNGDNKITIGDLGKMAAVFGHNVSSC